MWSITAPYLQAVYVDYIYIVTSTIIRPKFCSSGWLFLRMQLCIDIGNFPWYGSRLDFWYLFFRFRVTTTVRSTTTIVMCSDVELINCAAGKHATEVVLSQVIPHSTSRVMAAADHSSQFKPLSPFNARVNWTNSACVHVSFFRYHSDARGQPQHCRKIHTSSWRVRSLFHQRLWLANISNNIWTFDCGLRSRMGDIPSTIWECV